MIHKRTEGDRIWPGINWMHETNYVGLYFRFRDYVFKIRIRSKEYAKKLGGKRIFIAFKKQKPYIIDI